VTLPAPVLDVAYTGFVAVRHAPPRAYAGATVPGEAWFNMDLSAAVLRLLLALRTSATAARFRTWKDGAVVLHHVVGPEPADVRQPLAIVDAGPNADTLNQALDAIAKGSR
jgi:hypothetical protein